MADNKTTYTGVIDIETKGTGALKDLNRDLDASLEGFEDLGATIEKTRKALQQAKIDGDKVKFKNLRKELNTLEKQLEDTEITSRRFSDALAQQPGVVGLVGQSLKGLDGGLKVLAANPIIAVVTALVGIFMLLKESLTRTEEGSAKLTKITEGLEKIMNGLFAVIEPIAMMFADLVIGLLENEKVMDGLSKTVGVLTGIFTGLYGTLQAVGTFLIDNLVNNFKSVIAIATAAGDVIAGVFTFDWERVKKGSNAAFQAVKDNVNGQIDAYKDLATGVIDAVVSGYDAGEKGFKEGASRLTKAGKEEKKKFDEQTKQDNEDAAKQRLADEQAAAKIQLEAELSLLDEKERALIERQIRYDADKLALKKAGITNFLALDEEYALDKAKIEADAQAKIDAANAAADAITEADRIKKRDDGIADNQDEINLLLAIFDLESQTRQKSYDDEIALYKETRRLEKENLIASKATEKQIQAFEAETAAVSMQLEREKTEANLAQASMAFGTLAGLLGENSKAGKALAIGQAIIDTYAGATKALAQGGIFGAIAAAGVIAAGIANVKKITATKLPNLPGGKGGGAVSAPSIPSIQPPQIQSVEGGGLNPTSAISETIAQSQQRPIETYVVSSKVSSTQALDRRTNQAATFG